MKLVDSFGERMVGGNLILWGICATAILFKGKWFDLVAFGVNPDGILLQYGRVLLDRRTKTYIFSPSDIAESGPDLYALMRERWPTIEEAMLAVEEHFAGRGV